MKKCFKKFGKDKYLLGELAQDYRSLKKSNRSKTMWKEYNKIMFEIVAGNDYKSLWSNFFKFESLIFFFFFL